MSDPVDEPVSGGGDMLLDPDAISISVTLACADGPGQFEVHAAPNTTLADLRTALKRLAGYVDDCSLGTLTRASITLSMADPLPGPANPLALSNRKAVFTGVDTHGRPVRVSVPGANPGIFRKDGSVDEDNQFVKLLLDELKDAATPWTSVNGWPIFGWKGGHRDDRKTTAVRSPQIYTDPDTTAETSIVPV